jgi:D-alanyl-D-alanine carboxypeptidase
VLWRILAAIFVFLVAALPSVADASSGRTISAIVVDAKTGKTLYASNADQVRYPASVSKVMTLYILFQEMAAGHIKLTDRMPVSAWAASASPTKLGLAPGATITVDNAIRAIVTLSANDMARVVAEYVGGSESNFAKRMTATAQSLGMTHTTYVNASGLPDGRQVTTVRDQSILGMAIYEHFPQYYAYFQTASFTYGRRTYGNHDNLLGHNGIDGIKTGYTGAAGFNLLTAARINDKHIIVVGFGFPSAGSRDARVRDLVDSYLPNARAGTYLQTAMIPLPGHKGSPLPADDVEVAQIQPVMPMPLPGFHAPGSDDDADEAPANPVIGVGDVDTVDPVNVASLAPQGRPVDLGIAHTPAAAGAAAELAAPMPYPPPSEIVGAYTDSYSLGAPPAPLGQTRASAPLIPPVEVGGKGVDTTTSGDIAPAAQAVADASGATQPMPSALPTGWVVQIGAAPSETGANGLISGASGKVSALAQYQGFVQRFEKDGQTYFRARFGGFTGQDAANDICKQLKQANMSCLAMQS